MSIALVIANDGEAERLLPWAWRVAVAESTDLVLIRVMQRDEDTSFIDLDQPEDIDRAVPGLMEQWNALSQSSSGAEDIRPVIDEGANAEGAPLPSIKLLVKQLSHPRPDLALAEHLGRLGIDFLILPLDERLREGQGQGSWKGQLYRGAGSAVIFLRAPNPKAADLRRILVPTAGGDNADTALRLAIDIGKYHQAEVTALFVERPLGADSQLVGESILRKVVQRAVGRHADVVQKVVVADSLLDGIRQEMADPYDLVLIGAFTSRTIRRVFFGSVSNELFSGDAAPAFAAVRCPLPATTKVSQWAKRYVRRVVPQLDREGRVKIVERVQASSKWDFDFIALTCLSTLIAALGLAGNQAPVVIGAMLVAPLMTPLIGAGLSLVQGNAALVKDALKSVLFGFVLAFLVGCGVGFLVPIERVPAEVLNRTHPSLLDLCVALVSGIAAAYAMSRPNLISALPGVAIAAALVPPIATSGLSVALAITNSDDAYHHWVHAAGSLVLFATNIVAIILGTAVALWMVGVHAPKAGRTIESWTRWSIVTLMLLLIGLGFFVSHKRQLEQVTEQLRYVTAEFTRDRQSYAVVTDVRRGSSENELIVDLESDVTDLQDLPDRLRRVAAQAMDNDRLELRMQIRNVIRTGLR